MSARLKIVSPGLHCSLQDRGRLGYGRFGVPRSGAADAISLRLGNALVSNSPFETALEFRMMGPTLEAIGAPIRVGLAGNMAAEKIDAEADEVQKLIPWQSILLHPGDQLKVSTLHSGVTGYLTIEGGVELEPVLGSTATYGRAFLGGLHKGEMLKAGDEVAIRRAASEDDHNKLITQPDLPSPEPLRVMMGPQEDFFDESQLARFTTESFTIGREADRMGIRLQGTAIEAEAKKVGSMVSDGLVFGAIQVPGTGDPIILTVDCQSIGGYPKIATVIAADLHRLAHLASGDQIRFEAVTLDQAQQALRELEQSVQLAISSIIPYLGEGAVDLKALYGSNLVSGMVNATDPGHIPGHLEDMK